jgi:fucose permease
MTMNNTQKTFIVPMIIMAGMFSILGFAVGIDAFFIPFVKKAFNISNTMSYLVFIATYSSFVLFSIPSGFLMKKIGYRGGIVVAFVFLALSFGMIGFASAYFNYLLFLSALFVNGIGRVILNAAVNPYVTILGPRESAARRISMMGISNKVSYAAASLILALFLDLANVRMEDTVLPFYLIAGIILVMGIASCFAPLPELKAEGEEDKEDTDNRPLADVIASNNKTNLFQFPHLIFGLMAYFFYTGVEVIALGSINHYAGTLGLNNPQNYVWFTSGAMVAGYMIGVVLIPKVISQITALKMSALAGLVFCMLIVLTPAQTSIYFLALLGLANALILPAIWPVSLADLGKFTKPAAGLLVTGGLGGGIIPLLYGFTVDWIHSSPMAYLVCLPSYLVILYFATKGYKIRK